MYNDSGRIGDAVGVAKGILETFAIFRDHRDGVVALNLLDRAVRDKKFPIAMLEAVRKKFKAIGRERLRYRVGEMADKRRIGFQPDPLA
jgi:hypothetical protein